MMMLSNALLYDIDVDVDTDIDYDVVLALDILYWLQCSIGVGIYIALNGYNALNIYI